MNPFASQLQPLARLHANNTSTPVVGVTAQVAECRIHDSVIYDNKLAITRGDGGTSHVEVPNITTRVHVTWFAELVDKLYVLLSVDGIPSMMGRIAHDTQKAEWTSVSFDSEQMASGPQWARIVTLTGNRCLCVDTKDMCSLRISHYPISCAERIAEYAGLPVIGECAVFADHELRYVATRKTIWTFQRDGEYLHVIKSTSRKSVLASSMPVTGKCDIFDYRCRTYYVLPGGVFTSHRAEYMRNTVSLSAKLVKLRSSAYRDTSALKISLRIGGDTVERRMFEPQHYAAPVWRIKHNKITVYDGDRALVYTIDSAAPTPTLKEHTVTLDDATPINEYNYRIMHRAALVKTDAPYIIYCNHRVSKFYSLRLITPPGFTLIDIHGSWVYGYTGEEKPRKYRVTRRGMVEMIKA